MKSATIARNLSALALSSVVITISLDAKANATVVAFDDISTNNVDMIHNGYGGLNWNNMYYIKDTYHPGSGYDNGTISGSYTAFNNSGNPASVSGNVFDFYGTYLTGAWNDGLSVRVEGFLSGVLKYSQTVVVNTGDPQFFKFKFSQVDNLEFTSFGGTQNPNLDGGGTQFAMDNFTYNQVPEPATILGTLAFGTLGGSTFLKKRKSQKKA
jgi:hypothetical protein